MVQYTEEFFNIVFSIFGITEQEKVDRFVRGLKLVIRKEVWLR